jgi:hypothetical protein
MPSAASGLLLIDILIRPFCKLGVKFPIIGLLALMILYGFIGYMVLKSAYMVED